MGLRSSPVGFPDDIQPLPSLLSSCCQEGCDLPVLRDRARSGVSGFCLPLGGECARLLCWLWWNRRRRDVRGRFCACRYGAIADSMGQVDVATRDTGSSVVDTGWEEPNFTVPYGIAPMVFPCGLADLPNLLAVLSDHPFRCRRNAGHVRVPCAAANLLGGCLLPLPCVRAVLEHVSGRPNGGITLTCTAG